MDISKNEQRVLHVLAQGGRLEVRKTSSGRLTDADLFTRDGARLPNIPVSLVRKLKRRKTIASRGGGPYRVTRRGLELVRSQPDNR